MWDVMIALQRYGFRVHALVCDGNPVNRALQKKLVADAMEAGQENVTKYMIEHPLTAKPWARLFLLSDPSHAIKKYRNNWFNDEMAFSLSAPDPFPQRYLPLSHDLTRIRWSDLEDVRRWQQNHPRVDRRLTKKHLKMDNYSKMNVRTAVDVVSEAIENVMIEIDAVKTASTRAFMQIGRTFWLAMNDHRVYFSEVEARPVIEKLGHVSTLLRNWHENMQVAPQLRLTNETFEDSMLICDGIPPFMAYVWGVLSAELPNRIGFMPRVISQDPLEQVFGHLRQKGGGMQNLTVYSLAYNLRTINEIMLNDFLLLLNVDA